MSPFQYNFLVRLLDNLDVQNNFDKFCKFVYKCAYAFIHSIVDVYMCDSYEEKVTCFHAAGEKKDE